jgi:methyl-accepting chemotaxis protein
MGCNADVTSAQASLVATTAEQVSRNVKTVANGSMEMSATIQQIAKNAADGAAVATRAVKMAADTNATVAKLGESSAEIGHVIKVITSIAEQTNLLALNATIEAARAGDAGRGFAVVANEVKELAKATAKATDDIGRRIEAIQAETRGAITAIGHIAEVITRVNDLQNSIAVAVEEQAETTDNIKVNVNEAANSSSEIAQNIAGVAAAAQNTAAGAGRSQSAAGKLTQMAVGLQRLIAEFKYGAPAGPYDAERLLVDANQDALSVLRHANGHAHSMRDDH